ncbi:copper-binding protein [Polyangium mundeleinium]|uniref:Copper-binding protein n=1 Tax=Polyangium mundeleinium TaxID=2995306 RepID=A0ABT5ERA7_9BACT|nr:copper-binding protein [Polyangium mundeleinium]MDC0744362.1 copper-binding protein [Polyangium mundeleinium]
MRVISIHRTSPAVLATVAAMLLAAAPACSRSQEQPSGGAVPTAAPSATYSTRGKVRAIGEKKDNITIAHEDIPGYMKAMTMMFEVAKPELLRDVKVGDEVSFTFSDRDGRLFVESITPAAPK